MRGYVRLSVMPRVGVGRDPTRKVIHGPLAPRVHESLPHLIVSTPDGLHFKLHFLYP
jgi:hypothetical protein